MPRHKDRLKHHYVKGLEPTILKDRPHQKNLRGPSRGVTFVELADQGPLEMGLGRRLPGSGAVTITSAARSPAAQVESMSYKYGGFPDSLPGIRGHQTDRGRGARPARPEKNADVFHMDIKIRAPTGRWASAPNGTFKLNRREALRLGWIYINFPSFSGS
jgi:hypothetical protein